MTAKHPNPPSPQPAAALLSALADLGAAAPLVGLLSSTAERAFRIAERYTCAAQLSAVSHFALLSTADSPNRQLCMRIGSLLLDRVRRDVESGGQR